jgi:hypothetical protein
MRRARLHVRLAISLALLAPLTLAACGRRGPPLAPELRLPAAVADLAATVVPDGVRLTWTLPGTRVDRSPVKDLARAEVYRRLEERGAAAPPRPAVLSFGGLFGGPPELPGFERVANITLKDPGPAEVSGRAVTFTDAQGLALGRRYTYVVIAVDDQGRPSPPSNRAAIAVAAAPAAVTALAARPGDREVRLTWSAPASLADGAPLTGEVVYNVFRATTAEARPARPLNPEPLASPGYLDLGVQNDSTYYYSVQALRGRGGPVSPLSQVVSATPEDQTAPAQPRSLVAVVTGATVRLAWEAVADSDLAGYHVYRSTTAGRGHVKLTDRPTTGSTFVDDRVRSGETYYYVVTAIDRSRRANESVPSAEAAARIP